MTFERKTNSDTPKVKQTPKQVKIANNRKCLSFSVDVKIHIYSVIYIFSNQHQLRNQSCLNADVTRNTMAPFSQFRVDTKS